MKLIGINDGEIGLLVDLATGAHVIDLAKSLGVFAPHDPLSGALINGALNEKSAWVALVNNWSHLRKPLSLLARTALANPDDPRLVLYPLAHARQMKASSTGIVALDITDAADLEIHDPTGRLVMARQFGETVIEPARDDTPPIDANAEVIDFLRQRDSRTRRR